jgi:hypothetical protein
MSDIPEFPSGSKAFSPDELALEEQRQWYAAMREEGRRRRQKDADRLRARYQKMKKRPQRFERIKAHYRQSGDPLLPLSKIAETVAASVPNVTPAIVCEQFLADVERGDFRTGFRRDPEPDAINALVDFSSLWFAPGQYPLHPSLRIIKAAPEHMSGDQLSTRGSAPQAPASAAQPIAPSSSGEHMLSSPGSGTRACRDRCCQR